MLYDDAKGCWRFDRYETKVQRLLRMCGPWATAKYLQRRGYTAEQAVTLMYR